MPEVIHRSKIAVEVVTVADEAGWMPRTPYRPNELQYRVFRGAAAVRSGLLTPNQLRSEAWRRVQHDVYADSRLAITHELACRAAILCLPREAAIAGRSAAWLLGVGHAAKPADDVDIIVPRCLRGANRRGVRLHGFDLDQMERVKHLATDLPVTSPIRTAWDVSAWQDILESVPIVDGLLRRELVTKRQLVAYANTRASFRGGRRAARALALADGRSQSRPESELRVRCVNAGLPCPTPQLAVRLTNGLVLHPDLAWEKYKVALEYDGLWHADSEQLHRDRRRLNQLVVAGWLIIHVTSQRMSQDFPGVLNEIRSALVSRGWRPGA